MLSQDVLRGLTRVLQEPKVATDAAGVNLEKQRLSEGIVSEKQQALDDAIAAVQKNLQSPKVLEALQGKGERPLSKVLEALEIPILPDHLKGTTYDVSDLQKKYPAQIIISGEEYSILPARSSSSIETFRSSKAGNYGNCVFYEDKNKILTAAHVLYGEDPETYPIRDIDVCTRRVPSYMSAMDEEQIVIPDRSMTNTDLGQLVSVIGIDPDETSEIDGHKTYPGIAVKITPEIVPYLVGNLGESGGKYIPRIQNSYMFILPPGETKRTMGRNMRASGMSGSGVFNNLNKKFAGVFWGGMSYQDQATRRTVDIGFFTGTLEIRQVEEKMRLAEPGKEDRLNVNG